MLAHDGSRRARSQTAGNALGGSPYLWRLGPGVRLRREHFGGIACDTGTGTLVEVDREASRLLALLQGNGGVHEGRLVACLTDTADTSAVAACGAQH